MSVLGKTATTGFKVMATGVAAAATGVAALSTAAVKAYADYEQLVGGVETLFGTSGKSLGEYAASVGKTVNDVRNEFQALESAQAEVMKNAANAYKTAGLSQNEYMESVTSFAAALKQSTENELEAAKAADQAIIDMADNANKMGTSMEMIQNAYQGFAKQNYTMLDNLKLGYGGTKEEMQRLLADATALSGIEYDISSLADVYEAIHVIQTELGIAGTTVKEASTTISGSLGMVKASWSNLLVSMAEGENISDNIDALVESAGVAFENLLPVFETSLTGVGELIEEILPIAMERIPEVITEVIPKLLESGGNIIMALFRGIVDNFPLILELGLQLLLQLCMGIAQSLPMLIPQIVDIVLTIVDTLINNIDLLIDAAIALIIGLAQGLIAALPQLIQRVPEIVLKLTEALVRNAGKLGTAALQLIITLGKGLIENIPTLIDNIPAILEAVVSAFNVAVDMVKEVGKNIVEGIYKGLTENWDSIVSWLTDAAGKILGSVKKLFGIKSPSKEFEYIGKMCVAGFDVGTEDFEDSARHMEKTADGMTRHIKASMGTMSANSSISRKEEYYANLQNSTRVYLEGDAKGVFRIVRTENDIYTKQTGQSAFAY